MITVISINQQIIAKCMLYSLRVNERLSVQTSLEFEIIAYPFEFASERRNSTIPMKTEQLLQVAMAFCPQQMRTPEPRPDRRAKNCHAVYEALDKVRKPKVNE